MSLAEISQCTLREKLEIMEMIWEDLRRNVDRMEVPAEHQQLLDARRERVATGASALHDWDAVKHTLGRA